MLAQSLVKCNTYITNHHGQITIICGQADFALTKSGNT